MSRAAFVKCFYPGLLKIRHVIGSGLDKSVRDCFRIAVHERISLLTHGLQMQPYWGKPEAIEILSVCRRKKNAVQALDARADR